MKKYDAISILSGGINKKGELLEWTRDRADKAIELFSGKEFIICVSGYSANKPPFLDKTGFPIFEATGIAKYLIKKGIPENKIIAEAMSMDTIGNGFFTRIVHIDPRGFKKIAIITSEFHLHRAKAVFDKVFSLKPFQKKYIVDFILVSNKGIDLKTLEQRKERDEKSVKRFLNQTKNIKTISEFHNWIFTKHDIYRASFKRQNLKGEALKSY